MTLSTMAKAWIAFLLLLVLLQISAVSLVFMQHRHRALFAELRVSQQQYDELLLQFGQLKLEQSTWATHGRIERIAHEKLQMRIPEFDMVDIIQR